MNQTFVVAVLAILVAAGCQPDHPERDQESWYDADTPQWTIYDSANFAVSEAAIPGDTVRLDGIFRTSFADNGDILVALIRGTQQIISLDSLGHLRWKAGRTGDGPGEFRSIAELVSAGDETYVWDGLHRDVSVFKGATFLREVQVEGRGGRRLIGLVDDTLFVAAPDLIATTPGVARRYELWNGRATRVNLEQTKTADGWAGSQSNLATLAVTYDGGGQKVRTDLPACIVGMLDALIGNTIYVANVAGAPGRVHALEPLSGAQRVLYETKGGLTVTQPLVDDIRARFEKLVESTSRPSRGPGGMEVRHTNVRLVRDSVAAILGRIGEAGSGAGATWMDMIADETAGHLWLRRAVCAEDAEQEWEIIDTAGKLVARAVFSSGLQLRDVRYPRILITRVDSLGVEQLAVLKLLKG